ncbi:hypothetical protein MHYP_G00191470 [Metynnis hypsauchen]
MNPNPALMSSPWYRYQDDESPPPEHSFPRLTNEVRAPELVHVSEKNLSEIENVHGYVSHSHISPLKMVPAVACRWSTAAGYVSYITAAVSSYSACLRALEVLRFRQLRETKYS